MHKSGAYSKKFAQKTAKSKVEKRQHTNKTKTIHEKRATTMNREKEKKQTEPNQ